MKKCVNCRFCINAHSARGKEEPYCKLQKKWVGDTVFCSKWEAEPFNNLSKPFKTNADRIRAMSDEELANILTTINFSVEHSHEEWLDWLREETEYDL